MGTMCGTWAVFHGCFGFSCECVGVCLLTAFVLECLMSMSKERSCCRGSAEAGGLVGGLVCSSYKLVMMLQSVWGRVDACDCSMVRVKESFRTGYLLMVKGVSISTADWRKCWWTVSVVRPGRCLRMRCVGWVNTC